HLNRSDRRRLGAALGQRPSFGRSLGSTSPPRAQPALASHTRGVSTVAAAHVWKTLLEKLRKIEALHAETNVDGEREAARCAAERIRARLPEFRGREDDIERSHGRLIIRSRVSEQRACQLTK